MSEENKEAIKPSETVDEILTDEVYQEEEASEKANSMRASTSRKRRIDRIGMWFIPIPAMKTRL